jgi:hypothetical protein
MLNSSATPPPVVDSPQALVLEDIQGLVLRGYSYLNIRYFILKIRDGDEALAKARTFCDLLRPESKAPLTLTTANPWPAACRPSYCLNLGISNTGLARLIGAANYKTVKSKSLSLFTSVAGSSFDAGASASATANLVGDTDESAPAAWWPEANCKLPRPLKPDDMHLLLCLYTRSPEDRETWATALLDMIPTCDDGQPALVQAFVQDADPLPPPEVNFHGAIQVHFGYADGFTQPRIKGAPWDDPGDPDDDEPLVPSYHFAIANDPNANYRAHPLLLNGSFGAFRLLYQDVGAFNAFLGKSSTPDLLAAKMCGRWLDGTPLMVSPTGPDPTLEGVDFLNFDYLTPTPHQKGPGESDASGSLCPYAAHIRRTNPRDDAAVKGNFDMAEIHRVRRFATPYGPAYSPETASEERGLVGLFMGADLYNQFEFLMNSWMENGSFRVPDASWNQSGMDPLFGCHVHDKSAANQAFAYNVSGPSDPPNYSTVAPMTRFIVTKGGLYVFLPSLSALGYIGRGILPPS